MCCNATLRNFACFTFAVISFIKGGRLLDMSQLDFPPISTCCCLHSDDGLCSDGSLQLHSRKIH